VAGKGGCFWLKKSLVDGAVAETISTVQGENCRAVQEEQGLFLFFSLSLVDFRLLKNVFLW
jgi:hypothetical protein